MKEVVASLADIARGWTPSESNGSGIEENDWSRSSSLDIQDATYRRNALIDRLARRACIECEQFDDHVSLHLLLCDGPETDMDGGASMRRFINR